MSDVATRADLPRQQQKSLMPAQFFLLMRDIQVTTENLGNRYAELFQIINDQKASGLVERVGGGNTADIPASMVINNEKATNNLREASRAAQNAWRSLTASHGQLTSIEKSIARAEDRDEEEFDPNEHKQLLDQSSQGDMAKVYVRQRERLLEEQRSELKVLDEKIRRSIAKVTLDEAQDIIQNHRVRVERVQKLGETEVNYLERETRRLLKMIALSREPTKSKKSPKSKWGNK